MKIILTGSTGFIGHEILTQCLRNPHITSIIALSRRPLPTNNPKLTVRLVDDFLTYPESLLQELRGAEACIWAIGVNRTRDTETARRINVEYTMAAMRAFGTHLSFSVEGGGEFRFVYLSGGMSERDQSRSLWMAGETRKIRGQVENALSDYEKNNNNLEVYIARPGMVLARGMSLRTVIFRMGPSIWVDDLAKVLVDVVVKGDGDGERVLENERMLRWEH
ncbi:NAD(P)-binding protein [Aspergillus eucalypticola CBS 122712]|uniref:NAD(P)-binding protein n=1 Tax=Aspergillus eucalypticola (strain CBS 122712 / IBT 29274) TaxID=1448314 RepID=A0A317WH44_ASPEC|nr:NAD(P)-binding protein [Aspergillus eucalypticola CBS 122712]PWY84378.1 NAD(P)-binding protein [Aspergillus eucalypticola CBS 122712]